MVLASGSIAFSQTLSPGVMDVGKMSAAHVPEENIINYIKGSGITYHLTTDDIIYLNGQGATPNVLAVLQAAGPAPDAAPAPQEPPPTPAPSVTTAGLAWGQSAFF